MVSNLPSLTSSSLSHYYCLWLVIGRDYDMSGYGTNIERASHASYHESDGMVSAINLLIE